MKHVVVAAAFAAFLMTTPVLAQVESVREEFEACVQNMTQGCIWSLGDQLTAEGSDANATARILNDLTACLTNPSPDCAERAQNQIEQETDRRASNPVAAAMRDVCLEDPTAECLMTFAMAYSATPFIGAPFESVVEQILPFVTEGKIVPSTMEWRFVDSSSLSLANLNHVRWLLAKNDLDGIKKFLPRAAFTPEFEATVQKLLAVALAESGNIDEAFALASPLYVDDVDWTDRFELVSQVMGAYAALAPEQAPGVIEGLTGQTDQTAGFAGLAITLSKSNELEKANEFFQRAMTGIAASLNSGSRDDGYIYFGKQLAKAGAFDLSRTAIEAIESDLTREWTAFDLAEEMTAAGRQEEALAMLNAAAPDHNESSYYYLALRLGRTDLAAARSFVEGLEEPFRTSAAQGLVRALFEAGQTAESVAASKEFGSKFADSPSFGTDIPAFAAALAAQGKVGEAVALASGERFSTMAMSFAAIALEIKGGNWAQLVELVSLD